MGSWVVNPAHAFEAWDCFKALFASPSDVRTSMDVAALNHLQNTLHAEYQAAFSRFTFEVAQDADRLREARLELDGIARKLARVIDRRAGDGSRSLVMKNGFIGEHLVNKKKLVAYFTTAEEKARYLVTVDAQGLLRNAEGTLIDSMGAERNMASFAMDADGNLYVWNLSDLDDGRVLKHSSFSAGGPLTAAGEVRVQNGLLRTISRRSGHYFPSIASLRTAIKRLGRRGANISKMRTKWGI